MRYAVPGEVVFLVAASLTGLLLLAAALWYLFKPYIRRFNSFEARLRRHTNRERKKWLKSHR